MGSVMSIGRVPTEGGCCCDRMRLSGWVESEVMGAGCLLPE